MRTKDELFMLGEISTLLLYYKCLYIRRKDSVIYKYGEDRNGDVQRLKQFMRRCFREINLWKRKEYNFSG